MNDVVPKPELERAHYHKLSQSDLEKLGNEDAEAIHEQGRRLRIGIRVKCDTDKAWSLYIQAAHLGHPVALAYCLDFAKGTHRDIDRAIELYRGSTARGHPSGKTPLRTR